MNFKYFGLAIVGLFVALSVLGLLYSFVIVDEVEVLPADVWVSGDGSYGFDTNNDMLHFGIVPPGGSSTVRYISLENDRKYPVKISVLGTGDIEMWLYSYERDNKNNSGPFYTLEPHQEMEISLGLAPGYEVEEEKSYTGNVKIITKRII